MANVQIDTSSLTFTQFLIPERNSEVIEGADSPTISLEPGVYSFHQMPGLIGNFKFEVTPNGVIEYDGANEEFFDGRGTTILTVRGFTITFDGRALSHDLLPLVNGASILPRDRAHELTFIPAAGYGFALPSGQVADFRFDLGVNGQLVVDPRFAGFAQVTDSTLTLSGHRMTIDAQQLSHSLSLLHLGIELPRDRAHELTLIPAAGYGFVLPSGQVADFRFDLGVNGQLVVDPRFTGFAQVTDSTLTLSGHRVTIDGRQLSHALGLFALGIEPPQDRIHEVTLLPAAGYQFVLPSGTKADFRFDLHVDGRVTFHARFANLVQVTGRTLIISGLLLRNAFPGVDQTHPLYRRSKPAPRDKNKHHSTVAHIDLSKVHLEPFGPFNTLARAVDLFDERAAAAVSAATGLAESIQLFPVGVGEIELLEQKDYGQIAPTIFIPRAKCLAVLAFLDFFPDVADSFPEFFAGPQPLVSQAILKASPGSTSERPSIQSKKRIRLVAPIGGVAIGVR